MSLTQEVLVAKHQRMRIFALCLVTNKVPTDSNSPGDYNVDADMMVAKNKAPAVGRLLERLIINTPVD